MPTREYIGDACVAWHISSRSNSVGGNCVEAGQVEDGTSRVAVRHSRYRDGRIAVYEGHEWEAFVAAVKDGTFDFSS